MRVTDVGMDTMGFVVRLLEFCAMRCVVSTRYRHRASEGRVSRVSRILGVSVTGPGTCTHVLRATRHRCHPEN